MNFYKGLLLIILFLSIFSCYQEKSMNDEYAKRVWLDVERFWENEAGSYQEYFFTEGDSVLVKQSNILFGDCNYFECRYFQKEGARYYDFFSYHWNGSISHKRRARSEFLLAVGKEYFFDLKGIITKVIDHEEGFDFTLADVEKFAVEKGTSYYKIERYKEEEGSVYWIVTLPDAGDKCKSYIYLLDGINGNVFKESILNKPLWPLPVPLPFMREIEQ